MNKTKKTIAYPQDMSSIRGMVMTQIVLVGAEL